MTEYNGNTIHILEPCRDQCDGDVFRLDEVVTRYDVFRPGDVVTPHGDVFRLDDIVTCDDIFRPDDVVTRGVVLRPGEVMGSVLT